MARWNPFSRKKTKPSAPETAVPAPVEPTPASPAPETGGGGSSDVPPISDGGGAGGDDGGSQPNQPEKSGGIFGRFKSALKKTVNVLNTDIRDLVGKEGRLVDDQFLDELFAFLVKTDMGNGPAAKIRDDIGKQFRARKVMMDDLVGSAKTTIQEIMQQDNADVAVADSGPTVIMVVGVNGSGKTTSIAKLTKRFIDQGDKVVLGAGDTFRAAAVQQLTVWSERLGAEIITGRQGVDPASVAYKAAEAAVNSNAQTCIIDTAGRLQTQSNLMDELGRIRRVISKVIPDAPHEVLLVLDSTAGQNAISQARGFTEAAGCTGIILAKLDGSAKGGVAIPIRQEFGLPVKFVGLGETPDDLAKFDVQLYVDALFEQID